MKIMRDLIKGVIYDLGFWDWESQSALLFQVLAYR